MAKDYTFDKVVGLSGRIRFNHNEVNEEGVLQYYCFRIQFNAKGMNGSASRQSSSFINIGQPQSEPFTPKELYTRLKNGMGDNVADTLKELYVDLINDDIS